MAIDQSFRSTTKPSSWSTNPGEMPEARQSDQNFRSAEGRPQLKTDAGDAGLKPQSFDILYKKSDKRYPYRKNNIDRKKKNTLKRRRPTTEQKTITISDQAMVANFNALNADAQLLINDLMNALSNPDDAPTPPVIATSDKPVQAAALILRASIVGEFKSATVRRTSIYDQRRDGEEVADFIRRIWEEKVDAGEWKPMPEYRGKRSADGEAIEWVWTVFGTKGFLDGVHFTRTILSEVCPQAAARIKNWLAETNESGLKNSIPPAIPLPAKRGHAVNLVGGLSEIERKAAHSVQSNRAA